MGRAVHRHASGDTRRSRRGAIVARIVTVLLAFCMIGAASVVTPPAGAATAKMESDTDASGGPDMPTETPGAAIESLSSTSAISPSMTVRDRVIAAQAAVQTGKITAIFDYGNDVRTLATMIFDLGNSDRTARLHVLATYIEESGMRTIERIIVDGQAWQRQGMDAWQPVEMQGSVRDQVTAFLPNADRAPADPRTDPAPSRHALQWYDAPSDADISVDIDPETGIPLRTAQRIRSTGATLTVTYDMWNAPVTIQEP